jgi:hypothetical protein
MGGRSRPSCRYFAICTSIIASVGDTSVAFVEPMITLFGRSTNVLKE